MREGLWRLEGGLSGGEGLGNAEKSCDYPLLEHDISYLSERMETFLRSHCMGCHEGGPQDKAKHAQDAPGMATNFSKSERPGEKKEIGRGSFLYFPVAEMLPSACHLQRGHEN